VLSATESATKSAKICHKIIPSFAPKVSLPQFIKKIKISAGFQALNWNIL
jgi:hypothetical protein